MDFATIGSALGAATKAGDLVAKYIEIAKKKTGRTPTLREISRALQPIAVSTQEKLLQEMDNLQSEFTYANVDIDKPVSQIRKGRDGIINKLFLNPITLARFRHLEAKLLGIRWEFTALAHDVEAILRCEGREDELQEIAAANSELESRLSNIIHDDNLSIRQKITAMEEIAKEIYSHLTTIRDDD